MTERWKRVKLAAFQQSIEGPLLYERVGRVVCLYFATWLWTCSVQSSTLIFIHPQVYRERLDGFKISNGRDLRWNGLCRSVKVQISAAIWHKCDQRFGTNGYFRIPNCHVVKEPKGRCQRQSSSEFFIICAMFSLSHSILMILYHFIQALYYKSQTCLGVLLNTKCVFCQVADKLQLLLNHWNELWLLILKCSMHKSFDHSLS